jgi:hypothetical protein
MNRTLARAAVLLLAGILSSGAWADDAKPSSALESWLGGYDTSDSRKDVRETSRPLPPSGPATPVPYCGPSSPQCP